MLAAFAEFDAVLDPADELFGGVAVEAEGVGEFEEGVEQLADVRVDHRYHGMVGGDRLPALPVVVPGVVARDGPRRAGYVGEVVGRRGPEGIAIFTGNPRYFPVAPEDLSTLCEEWVGPGLFASDLAAAAAAHLGGDGSEAVAVFNRTSAGIVAGVLALSAGRPVVSLVPAGDRSHASVVRGCRLAQVPLAEVEAGQDMVPVLSEQRPSLVVVTTVTSTLARLDDGTARDAVAAAGAAGATVLLDEAYRGERPSSSSPSRRIL